MTGSTVVILYEDRASRGFHDLITALVNEARNRAGRPPARLHAHPANGNSQLIRKCEDYQLLRYNAPYRADHVVVIIDAYNVEGVAGIPRQKWAKSNSAKFRDQCGKHEDTIRRILRDRAFQGMTPEARAKEETHFHPFVLFWEVESIFLAGGETLEGTRGLRLGARSMTESGIMAARCPSKVVEDAWRAGHGAGVSYKKAADGPKLFEDLRKARHSWPRLLERIPCLRNIVEVVGAL